MLQQTSTNIKSQTKTDGKSRRGFASMDKARHKLVSSIGGKADRKKFMESAQEKSQG